MQLSFTDNIATKLVDVLNPALYEAKKVKFAVAFMKYSGFSLIEESLGECLEKGGEAECLVGLDFRTTEPKVLRRLRQLSDDGYRIQCYCFSDPSVGDTPVYHPKLYLLMDDERAVISVGSSNLTEGGLTSNVEVNAIITADLKEEIVSDIYALYNRLKFQQRRFEPSVEYIEKYEEVYERVQKRSTQAFREKKTRVLVTELKEKEEALPKPIPTGSELFGWQKLVYDRLPLGVFRTSDMYRYEEEFQKHYPENRNVRAKIRQILQQLRDIGLIKNPHRDRWERF
jgi:HKD family nuclease